MNKENTLSDVLKGETCEFVRIDDKINLTTRIRLSALGFIPKTKIRVIRTIPNYLVKVKGAKYALSKKISKNMYVKKMIVNYLLNA